jgi:Cd2+/Zn2+-exporting ATPase
VWAVIGLRDPIRAEAPEALARLRAKGVERITLVTGDNAATARAVARELALDEVHAELLPEDKVEAVRELRRRYDRVAMVGDGVNDVQAMNAASVGIAFGRKATDVALETADIVVMSEDLRQVRFTMGHARRASAVIRQNVAIALGFKAVFLALAAMQLATLWLAVAADMGATLLVTLNGLRMLWVPKRYRQPAPPAAAAGESCQEHGHGCCGPGEGHAGHAPAHEHCGHDHKH